VRKNGKPIMAKCNKVKIKIIIFLKITIYFKLVKSGVGLRKDIIIEIFSIIKNRQWHIIFITMEFSS